MKLNMHSRSEKEFKKMIFDKSSTEKKCTYIHYSGQFNSLKDVKDFFPFNDLSIFKGKEIFNKEYFSSQISLSNNLSFICEINNIDINKFLEEHDLIEDLKQETRLYVHIKDVAKEFEDLEIKSGEEFFQQNMIKCYKIYQKYNFINDLEFQLIDAWFEDLSKT